MKAGRGEDIERLLASGLTRASELDHGDGRASGGGALGHGSQNDAFMRRSQQLSCDCSAPAVAGHTLRMASEADQIRDWLKRTLQEKGLSVEQWARDAKVHKSTIFRALKPSWHYVTSSRTLAKLAIAANVTPPSLTQVKDSGSLRVHPRFLVVRHKVQAGYWLEVDSTVQAITAQYPVAPDPRYATIEQWLEQVVGDSMDREIPEGAFAHVVDAIGLGYSPATGDLVIVERRRAGGLLRERTIKQVEITAAGTVQLWPRSTNPRWTEPLELSGGSKPGEDVEVEIVAKVIGDYRPR